MLALVLSDRNQRTEAKAVAQPVCGSTAATLAPIRDLLFKAQLCESGHHEPLIDVFELPEKVQPRGESSKKNVTIYGVCRKIIAGTGNIFFAFLLGIIPVCRQFLQSFNINPHSEGG